MVEKHEGSRVRVRGSALAASYTRGREKSRLEYSLDENPTSKYSGVKVLDKGFHESRFTLLALAKELKFFPPMT